MSKYTLSDLDKLVQEKEIAEQARNAQSKFLANVSHEIRTPIQTIIGTCELLSETKLDREQTEYCRQIKFSSEILLSLVNDVLDYAKIEAGKMELEKNEIDLEDLIEQVVDMIAIEAHQKGLGIASSIPPEAIIIFEGDLIRLRQIILNLIKNAVKFTNEGTVIVKVELTQACEQEILDIFIIDTGIGINEEIQSHIFNRFAQFDTQGSARLVGTGLGLTISLDLVKLMNGTIEVSPNPGGGSIFCIKIPIVRSEKKCAPLPEPEKNGLLKILVVDSSSDKQCVINSYLKYLGYTDISLANSGEQALKMMRSAAAKKSAFEMCFIDMMMPVMDGWRLAAEIYHDEKIKSADLILMVPQGLLDANAKMTHLKWFKAYINKPIKRRSLAETISSCINEPYVLEWPVEAENYEDLPSEENPLVLVAEDHPVNQKVLAALFRKMGYPSVLADDGQDAIEKLELHEIAIVFMDLQMPRLDGYDSAKELRKRGFNNPIIAITASALPDERERCLQAGIDDILIKPFKRYELEEMLAKWIGLSYTLEEREADFNSTRLDSIFDMEELLDTFMGDEEALLPLIGQFIERTQNQLHNLSKLKRTSDWKNAKREAHMLKGASLTMGGMELGKAAARLEAAYLNMARSEIKEALPQTKEAFERFKKEAEAFVHSRS